MSSCLLTINILLLHIISGQYINQTCQQPPLSSYPYCNKNLPINERVEDLLSRLTLIEKIFLQNSDQGGVPRLGLPTLGHSECNRGGFVSLPPYTPNCTKNFSIPTDFPLTLFPQAINLAGSFSRNLFQRIARAISNEIRAKYNQAAKFGCQQDNNFGIACWAPMINICRDPRWGRCQEGYGEDPLLMSELVNEFVPNLQNDPNIDDYLQTVSTCKHFDAFSGPGNMINLDSIVNYRDLLQTYLPAFKACNKSGTSSFMCSYTEINGIPSCGNKEFLTDILRKEWGFQGYVTSDCGAVEFIYDEQGSARNYIEAAQMAIKAGCDWIGSCLGPDPNELNLDLYDGIINGTISIKYLNNALRRVLPYWFKLGLVDYPNINPWSDLDLMDLYNKHESLAFEAAIKSMILFKNDNDTLPFSFDGKHIAVIGPCINNTVCYSGDYGGIPLNYITPLDAIISVVGLNNILFESGCPDPTCSTINSSNEWSNITDIVEKSDIIIFIGGISYEQEAENLDRKEIELPHNQSLLFQYVYKAANNKPIISILTYGAPVIDHFLFNHSAAILGAGYSGEMIGDSIMSLLNGSYSPSGKTTVTWYNGTSQLITENNYDMMYYPGRTYKYINQTVLFPFGYGLSYVKWKYYNLSLNGISLNNNLIITPCQSINVEINLMNIGGNKYKLNADESIMVYLMVMNKTYPVDNLRLVNFTRIENIKINENMLINLKIKPQSMTVIQTNYFNELIIPGIYQVMVGGILNFYQNNPLKRNYPTLLKQNFTIIGNPTKISDCY